MTVQRMEGTVCAGWTYVEERPAESWMVVLRSVDGQWVQLDDAGVTYDRTPEKLREFIDEWIADADIDNGISTPYPCDDVVAVYRQAAAFIEEAGASG